MHQQLVFQGKVQGIERALSAAQKACLHEATQALLSFGRVIPLRAGQPSGSGLDGLQPNRPCVLQKELLGLHGP